MADERGTKVWFPRTNRSRGGWFGGLTEVGLGPIDFQSPMDFHRKHQGVSRYAGEDGKIDVDKVIAELPEYFRIEASLEEFTIWAQAVGNAAANDPKGSSFYGSRSGAGKVGDLQRWRFNGPFPFRAWSHAVCYGCGKPKGASINAGSCPTGIPCCAGRHRSGGSAKCFHAILENLAACPCCGRLDVRTWDRPCDDCEKLLDIGREETKRRKDTAPVQVGIPYGEVGEGLKTMLQALGVGVGQVTRSPTGLSQMVVSLPSDAAIGLEKAIASIDKGLKSAHASGRDLLFGLANGELTVGDFDKAAARRE